MNLSLAVENLERPLECIMPTLTMLMCQIMVFVDSLIFSTSTSE